MPLTLLVPLPVDPIVACLLLAGKTVWGQGRPWQTATDRVLFPAPPQSTLSFHIGFLGLLAPEMPDERSPGMQAQLAAEGLPCTERRKQDPFVDTTSGYK